MTLTQLALQVQRSLSVKVTFRQIMENYPSMSSLAGLLDERLPPEEAPAPGPMPAVAVPTATIPLPAAASGGAEPSSYLRQVIDQQLLLMAQQLAVLGGTAAKPAPLPAPAPVAAARAAPTHSPKPDEEIPSGPVAYDVKKAFGAIARIHTKADELTPQQRARLGAFIRRYTERTRRSKAYTVEHRGHIEADGAALGIVPQEPRGQASDAALLGHAHRLGRHAEAAGGAALDLAEHHRPIPADHEVKLPVAAAPVAGQDLVAGGLKGGSQDGQVRRHIVHQTTSAA